MFEDHNDTLREIVAQAGFAPAAQIDELWEAHHNTGKPFADTLIDAGLADRTAVLEAVARHVGTEFMSVPPDTIDPTLLRLLKPEQAHKYSVIPLTSDGNRVRLLAKDPLNFSIVDELSFLLGRDIELVVGDPDTMDNTVRHFYGVVTNSLTDLIHEIEGVNALGENASDKEISGAAQQAPIIRFVERVLEEAIKAKASDIHFEPFEDQFRIRYRIDGALYEMAPPPKSLASAVVARVKVMSSLNIAERRVPQDGRIKTTMAGRPIDLRVSTLPTQYGESVVCRILDKNAVNLDLENLSMAQEIKDGIREMVARPNGIFIVTGPTGSGKTTTLYSALRETNTPDIKIITAEDPVEYEIEGIMQVQINHQVGLTFAGALRSFLRQDPDTIMIGEIRDIETAQIAVQASLTGHVVLSTLHTNDAAGAVTRLIDMGLESYLIAASLEGVLAQRLLRKVCKTCKTSYEPDQQIMNMLQVDPLTIADKHFYYGNGCPECNRSGYRGRQGLFEFIRVNDSLRDLITEKAPTLVIKQKAIENGMRPLREDGMRCIFDGLTTIEEVLKYT